jgi:hypothetical protein
VNRDEKIDLMAEQASAACFTDVGTRLIGATFTDGLVTRVIGADNPDRIQIAKSMTKEAILEVAEREAIGLGETEREQLRDDVTGHVRQRVIAAVKHCWTICDALGYDPVILHPEAIAWCAAFVTIPVDAEHPPSDGP